MYTRTRSCSEKTWNTIIIKAMQQFVECTKLCITSLYLFIYINILGWTYRNISIDINSTQEWMEKMAIVIPEELVPIFFAISQITTRTFTENVHKNLIWTDTSGKICKVSQCYMYRHIYKIIIMTNQVTWRITIALFLWLSKYKQSFFYQQGKPPSLFVHLGNVRTIFFLFMLYIITT